MMMKTIAANTNILHVDVAGELHPGQHWQELRCGLRCEPSHPLPSSWSLLLWAKQVTHILFSYAPKSTPLSANSLCQFLSPPIPAKSKIVVSAVVTQIVPTQTLTCSLELWLVGQERQMTSNQSYSRMHSSSIRNTQKILIFAHHYSVVYIYERNSSFLC